MLACQKPSGFVGLISFAGTFTFWCVLCAQNEFYRKKWHANRIMGTESTVIRPSIDRTHHERSEATMRKSSLAFRDWMSRLGMVTARQNSEVGGFWTKSAKQVTSIAYHTAFVEWVDKFQGTFYSIWENSSWDRCRRVEAAWLFRRNTQREDFHVKLQMILWRNSCQPK